MSIQNEVVIPVEPSAGPAEPVGPVEPSVEPVEPSAELAELFGRAARRLHRGSREALAPLGLSGSQAHLVRLLAGGPLRMASIAERMAVVPRTVTDVVDGAETAGVVARRPDPDDRRSTRVELTPAGWELLDRLDAIRQESAAAVFGVLSDTERANLLLLLRAICSAEGCHGHGGTLHRPAAMRQRGVA